MHIAATLLTFLTSLTIFFVVKYRAHFHCPIGKKKQKKTALCSTVNRNETEVLKAKKENTES